MQHGPFSSDFPVSDSESLAWKDWENRTDSIAFEGTIPCLAVFGNRVLWRSGDAPSPADPGTGSI